MYKLHFPEAFLICLASVKKSTVIAIGYVFLFIFFTEVQLIYYVLLFAVQQSDSVIHIHTFLGHVFPEPRDIWVLCHRYISIHPLLVKLYNRALGDKDRKRDPGLNTGVRRQSPRRNCKHRREGFRESEAGPGHRERKTKNRVLAGPRRGGEGEVWGKVKLRERDEEYL